MQTCFNVAVCSRSSTAAAPYASFRPYSTSVGQPDGHADHVRTANSRLPVAPRCQLALSLRVSSYRYVMVCNPDTLHPFAHPRALESTQADTVHHRAHVQCGDELVARCVIERVLQCHRRNSRRCVRATVAGPALAQMSPCAAVQREPSATAVIAIK